MSAPTLPDPQPDGGTAPDLGATRAYTPRPVERPTAVPTPAAAGVEDQAGTAFGRYRLLEQLGAGGMGVVWKAWDTQLRRVVALKQIRSEGGVSADQVQRFLREAQLAAKLAHPNIVGVHDVGEHEGQRFFTSEYIEGRSLDRMLGQPFGHRQVVEWVRDVSQALHYAHRQGVVHRDIKPGNILIDAQGRPHVTDFGLAREVDLGSGVRAEGRGLTMHGDILGTPEYMSPEQANGDVERLGPGTDQFSLGVVLYELLTGHQPFFGKTLMDLLRAVVADDPRRPRAIDDRIPADLETICLKALEKDPARRYASTADLAADLQRYLDREPILARPVSLPSRIIRRAIKYRRRILPAVVLAVGWATYAIVRMGISGRESDAVQLQEEGRPALERAVRYLYHPEYRYEELVRKVDLGQPSLEQAVEVAPNLGSGHTLLGRAWDLKGDEFQAERCWREAIRREPGYGPAHYRLGRLLLVRAFCTGLLSRLADRDARMTALMAEAGRELALGVEGGGVGVGAEGETLSREELAGAVSMLARGDLEAVRAACRRAVERSGEAEGAEELWWILGCVTAGEDRARAWDRAVRTRPNFALGLLCRGAAAQDAGDLPAARADLDAALQSNPRLHWAWFRRGLLRRDDGDPAGGNEDLRLAIQFAPHDWPERAEVERVLAGR